MDLEVRVLIVEKGLESGASLVSALFPELVVTGFEVRRTLHQAFQEIRESEFDICFIAEEFSEDDVQAFFVDLKSTDRFNESLYVKLMKKFPENFEPLSVQEKGFNLAIRRTPTEGDKALLRSTTQKFIKEKEVIKKCIDVDLAVKLILKEIDRVGSDRKRGIARKFTRNIVSSFMSDQVYSHEDVMQGLLNALTKHLEDAKPEKQIKVVIPEGVLDKSLPGLENNTYNGVSNRVWSMLKDKFGVEEGTETTQIVTPETEEKVEEEATPEEETTDESSTDTHE